MARFKNAKGREQGSGYARLFNDKELGALISRVHAAVISSGTELEQVVKDKLHLIEDLDEFLKRDIMQDGVMAADKKKVKKCKTLNFAGSEPDFLIFKRKHEKQNCHIIELKDGDNFDTKKASAEYRSMHSFISKNASRIPYRVHSHFCCFNQDSKQAILDGFRNKISLQEAMTGREFCELLELDYDKMVRARQEYGAENKREFLSDLIKIESVKTILMQLLKI